MKQHITVEQLNELSEKGRVALRRWTLARFPETRGVYVEWVRTSPPLPLLSIGQMIEFLDQYILDEILSPNQVGECEGFIKKEKLCDTLWEAVKEVLEY